jgi:hypothetical protein
MKVSRIPFSLVSGTILPRSGIIEKYEFLSWATLKLRNFPFNIIALFDRREEYRH